MSIDPSQVANQLADLLHVNDGAAADVLVRQIVEHLRAALPLELGDARRMLGDLRRKRRFASMSALAEASLLSGLDAPRIRRQFGQALIDQGHYAAARFVLETIAAPETEQVEAVGLLGRLYKQWLVNPGGGLPLGNLALLDRAISYYRGPWEGSPDRHHWHGINVCALLAFGERRDRPGFMTSKAAAERILADLAANEGAGDLDTWALATRMEAYVGVKKYPEALRTLGHYLRTPAADAFELASTLRQLEEIWELTIDDEPGATLLPLLKAALLAKQDGRIEFSSARAMAAIEKLAKQPNLEAVIGDGLFRTLRWFELGLERSRSVARIETNSGEKVGTAWLVRGSDFNTAWGDDLYLITNKHVISPMHNGMRFPLPDGRRAPLAAECRVNFQGLGTLCEIDPTVVWSSPCLDVDATFVKVRNLPAGAAALPHDPVPVGPQQRPNRVYIIGHPEGRDLEFSLEDNKVVDVNDTKLHYRAPTQGGSSGSPVFEDKSWNVVALHHAGGQVVPRLTSTGVYSANEGILLETIKRAISA